MISRRFRPMINLLLLLASVGLSHASPLESIPSSDLEPSSLTVRPQNTAVVMGKNVTLTCAINSFLPKSRVMWSEYISSRKGSVVSVNERILQGHPNAPRYRIIHNTPTQFNLEIRDVTLSDAGRYSCEDANKGSQSKTQSNNRGFAELIVIEAERNCTSTVPTNGVVLEDKTYTAECTVNFRGAYSPILTWSGPKPYNVTGATTPTSVRSIITFIADRSMDTRAHTCKTNFTDIDDVPRCDAAYNIPAYNQVYNNYQLFVYWKPKSLYVAPVKSIYNVGDTLTCYADSFPPAFYSWFNTETLEVTSSQVFSVTADMAGKNYTLVCSAQNLIQGFLYTERINVSVPVKELGPCLLDQQSLSNKSDLKYLTMKPQNMATLVGQTVTLTCDVHQAPPTSRVQWYEYTSSNKSSTVSDNEWILPGHPNSPRYRIIHATPTQFNLEIRNVTLSDGGRYSCEDVNEKSQNLKRGEAELIVIESESNCTSTYSPNGIVLEDQVYNTECTVNFRGAYPPTLTWSGPKPFTTIVETSSTSVSSSVSFTANRTMDLQHYKCKTHFTLLNDALTEDSATNIPTYNYFHSTNELHIYWNPKGMSIQPNQSTYSVGEMLTCHADSNPPSNFTWLNMRTLQTFTSPHFTITSDMAGTSQPMKCEASNLIAGIQYSTYVIALTHVEEVQP